MKKDSTVKKQNIENSIIEELLENFPLTDNAKRESNSTSSKKANPFLQWVGGKREFINNYNDYFPKNYGNYHEPFLGGGAVLFHLDPCNAYVSDLNLELVQSYNAIKDTPEEIIRLLKKLKFKHSKELYYAVRSLDREHNFETVSPHEIAARMIYLNQTGFNGVYRVNKKGQYNVPIGSSLNRLICDEENILKVSEFLNNQNIDIKHRDYSTVLEYAKSGDFVYLDPPYAPAGGYSDFVRYTKEQFGLQDQQNVGEVFKKLDEIGCKVAMSNADVEVVRDIYDGFDFLPVLSSRNLSSKKDTRGKVKEVLVVNYEIGE